ncbi:MAG: hypothetical protein NT116_02065 [Candidatus Parcubacteria bacterium]|nr:hypothetical protein [Candidatus Parcubacteria bacterium]
MKRFKKTFPDLPKKICKALDEGDYLTLNIFLTSVLKFPEWPKGTKDRYKRIHKLRDELHTFDFDSSKGHAERIVGYDQDGEPIWEEVKKGGINGN